MYFMLASLVWYINLRVMKLTWNQIEFTKFILVALNAFYFILLSSEYY